MARLLIRTDQIKTADHAQFMINMKRLEAVRRRLPNAQQEYLRYLKGWKSAYDGDYETAIARLKVITDQGKNPTLQFRAGVTLVNLLSVSGRYEDAFTRLNTLFGQLPKITDSVAREQGLLVAASLYNEVGQFDLSLIHSQSIIDESRFPGSQCKGGTRKLRALFESGKLQKADGEMQAGIETCVKAGELQYANWIRTYAAKLHIRYRKHDEAIKTLNDHYSEVRTTQYPRLISEFDALLAQAHREKHELPLAWAAALNAVDHAVKGEFTEPLVIAYRVLYEVAKERGDTQLALTYHEKYAEADKGYLDVMSTRQLAYQRVKHEILANQLQIEALAKQNQLLQVQQALGAKAVENSRLWMVLLLTVLASLMLWFYKTKRSQLHFRHLSRTDGLTGISNRSHFISQAEAALEESRKNQQELCVVLCDLDHFKWINDSHGHEMGDAVLKQAVAACRELLRSGDIFGRYGGEEFSILLPGCDVDTAWQRSEQLREAIAKTAGKQGDKMLNVSASFGVTSTKVSGYELRHLLAHADKALFQAKKTRNRVSVYDATATSDGLLLDINDRLRTVGS